MTRFLEYQVVLGGVYDVQKREFHSLHEAVDNGLIESRKAERLADFSVSKGLSSLIPYELFSVTHGS